MAHNRLYIFDSKTGDRLFVAKSFGEGWDWRATPEEITQWMTDRDYAASYHDCWDGKSSLAFVTENEDKQ